MPPKDPYSYFISHENDSSPCLFTITEGNRLVWEVTNTCNLGCSHCSVDSPRDGEDPKGSKLKLKKSIEITRELVDNGVDSIYISGGEPGLWKPLGEFIPRAKELGVGLISVASNGTIAEAYTSEELANMGMDKVLISLDSHLRDRHDSFRGATNSYDRAVSAIIDLLKQNVYLRVGSVIWSGNVDQLEEMTRFLNDLGANEVAYNWLVKTGRVAINHQVLVPWDRYREVGYRLRSMRSFYEDNDILISFHRFNELDDNSIGCPGGKKIWHIYSHGGLSPCSWITKTLPQYITSNTIFDASLSQLMRDPRIQSFREMVRRREDIYGPGCPAICISENGSIMSRDPLYRGLK